MVEEFKKVFKDELFGNDLEAIIADGRYKYITTNYSPTLTKRRQNEAEMTSSDKVDRVLTHRIWGIPIFLVILLPFSILLSVLTFYFSADFSVKTGYHVPALRSKACSAKAESVLPA